MRERLSVNFSRLTLDAGGLEFFRVGAGVDGHSARPAAKPLPLFIYNPPRRALSSPASAGLTQSI